MCRIGAWFLVKALILSAHPGELRGQPAADLPVESRFLTDGPLNSFEPEAREACRLSSAYTDPFGPRLDLILSLRSSGDVFLQPATNGRAGGKLPAGKQAVRSPRRSFSAASRNAATNEA